MFLSPEWFSVERIDAWTYAVSEYGHWKEAHSYLFLGQQKAALVDTGLGIGNIKKVIKDITNLPIIVITTHSHWDHMGSHIFFDEIGIHEADRQWLESGLITSNEQVKNELLREPFRKDPPPNFHIEEYEVFSGKPVWIFKDMNIINLGGRLLKIVHTPGHTPGHICVLEEATGYLATGDLIYQGILRMDYEESDPVLFARSLERISMLPRISKILPGHFNIGIKMEYIKQVNYALSQLKTTGMLKKGIGPFEVEGIQVRL
jgi:glyoxylase-like metal-dependent hydrolase (beta-lactamase superfamily II)